MEVFHLQDPWFMEGKDGDFAVRSLETARFGALEVQEEDVFLFPRGIPAFETYSEWILLGEDDKPVKWLQSLSDGDVALPVLPIASSDRAELGGGSPADVTSGTEAETHQKNMDMLLVLSVPQGEPWNMTVNLKAPILINKKNRNAYQVVMANKNGDLKNYVFDETQRESMIAYIEKA
jgi:flagellar assembly factor FliW